MSEFERARSAVPPFTPPLRPERLLQEEDEPSFAREGAFQREGLPAGFRMRHDAHYVDQLTARSAGPQVRQIPLRDIDAPREADTRDLGPLTASIAKHGVLQPLLVRPRGGRFALIAGRRRLAAGAAAGLTELPCIVHHVDDVRARAIADAENVRAVPVARAAAPADPAQDVPPIGLRELSQSFGAIGSCLHLLGERDAALRDRVALDLIRTEVHRAARLVQCLTAIGTTPTLSETGISLTAAFESVAEGFAPERRLSGASLTIETGDGPDLVRADSEWLAVGLSGALGGVLALVHCARNAAITARISATASRSSVMLELSQQAVTVPAPALGKFFDVQWTDRPGGYQAAVELAAARTITELHRGGIEVIPGERSGSRVVLLFPAA